MKHTSREGRVMATVKVGEKGQIVIPKEFRELFSIAPGDSLLLLGDKQRGMAILCGDRVQTAIGEILDAEAII